MLREPSYVVHPRFWAEEGQLHFAYSYAHVWYQALFHPQLGYLNLYPNLSTLLAARLVPLQHAPAVTTLMALGAQLLPLAWILTTTSLLGRSLSTRLLAVAVVLLVPLTAESWLNSINSMGFFGVVTFLILIEPAESVPVRRWTSRVLLLVGSLSGLYGCFLFPLFVVRALQERSRSRWAQVVVLLAGVAIQAALIASSSGEGSSTSRLASVRHFDVGTLAAIFLTQSLALIAAGASLTTGIATRLLALDIGRPALFQGVGMLLLLGELLALGYLSYGLPAKERIHFLYAYLIVLTVTVLVSVDADKAALMETGRAQRHFLLPNAVLGLMLLANLDRSSGRAPRSRRLVAGAILGAALFWGVFQYPFALTPSTEWPIWTEEVALWRADPGYAPRIAPDGWSVRLADRD